MIRLISSQATHDEHSLYLHTVDGIDGPRMLETRIFASRTSQALCCMVWHRACFAATWASGNSLQ